MLLEVPHIMANSPVFSVKFLLLPADIIAIIFFSEHFRVQCAKRHRRSRGGFKRQFFGEERFEQLLFIEVPPKPS